MKKKTLLWEISGEDIKSPCYIFGTMHVRDSRILAILPKVQECLLQCEAFAAEYELSENDSEALFHALLLPNGMTLKDLMSKKLYEKLSLVFERETGIPLDHLLDRKPMVLSNMLSEAQMQDDEDVSMDEALYRSAEEHQKTLLGLETFERQLNILQKLPLEDQVKSLKTAATNFKKFRKGILKMADWYLAADLDKILKKVKQNSGGMRRTLLYERNAHMAERIVLLAEQHSLFAAVGAAHLPGGKGVLRLLKRKGLQVKPIFLSPDPSTLDT